mmetsp:Transcript_25413/g.82187  ORF Transcript_25413/g.82187 Transcript_25413/m.82187 type:complete len:734 (+) Transcript_25413:135-2336(+)
MPASAWTPNAMPVLAIDSSGASVAVLTQCASWTQSMASHGRFESAHTHLYNCMCDGGSILRQVLLFEIEHVELMTFCKHTRLHEMLMATSIPILSHAVSGKTSKSAQRLHITCLSRLHAAKPTRKDNNLSHIFDWNIVGVITNRKDQLSPVSSVIKDPTFGVAVIASLLLGCTAGQFATMLSFFLRDAITQSKTSPSELVAAAFSDELAPYQSSALVAQAGGLLEVWCVSKEMVFLERLWTGIIVRCIFRAALRGPLCQALRVDAIVTGDTNPAMTSLMPQCSLSHRVADDAGKVKAKICAAGFEAIAAAISWQDGARSDVTALHAAPTAIAMEDAAQSRNPLASSSGMSTRHAEGYLPSLRDRRPLVMAAIWQMMDVKQRGIVIASAGERVFTWSIVSPFAVQLLARSSAGNLSLLLTLLTANQIDRMVLGREDLSAPLVTVETSECVAVAKQHSFSINAMGACDCVLLALEKAALSRIEGSALESSASDRCVLVTPCVDAALVGDERIVLTPACLKPLATKWTDGNLESARCLLVHVHEASALVALALTTAGDLLHAAPRGNTSLKHSCALQGRDVFILHLHSLDIPLRLQQRSLRPQRKSALPYPADLDSRNNGEPRNSGVSPRSLAQESHVWSERDVRWPRSSATLSTSYRVGSRTAAALPGTSAFRRIVTRHVGRPEHRRSHSNYSKPDHKQDAALLPQLSLPVTHVEDQETKVTCQIGSFENDLRRA